MKRAIASSLVLLAVLALASCSKGPTTPSAPGVLIGIVRDTLSNDSLAGAKVVAGTSDSTWTGADGKFTLALLQGRHTIQVSKDGYYGAAANVPIISRDTTRITVYTRLRPWAPGNVMPEARHHFASATALNEIYVIAGIGVFGGATTRYSSLMSYGPPADLWTTSGLTSISVHRELPGCAALGGKIFVFGGSVGSGDTALCQEYDFLSNSWQNHTPIPAACRAMAAVAVGDSIFVIGGIAGSTSTDSVRVYKPSADSAGGTPWRTAQNLPAARGGASAAFVNGRIYFFGGLAGGMAQSSVFEYNPITNSWTAGANMPAARAYMACAVYGNRVYLFGGMESNAARNSVYRYDPGANSWTVMESMPLARYGAGAATVGSRIYVLGGFDGTNSLTASEVYNPLADSK